MSEITAEDIAKSLLPQVDHLTYEHVKHQPIILKVARVCHGPNKKERPVRIDFDPHERCVDKDGKPLHYLPCKGMRVVLAEVWGLNGREDWVGKSLELFGNPDVQYGGQAVGGIQIAKMSHIDKPTTVMLKVRRGTSQPFVVEPLKVQEPLTPEEAAFIAQATKDIESVPTMEGLTACANVLKGKSKAVQDALRPVWSKRRKELTEQATLGPTQTA